MMVLTLHVFFFSEFSGNDNLSDFFSLYFVNFEGDLLLWKLTEASCHWFHYRSSAFWSTCLLKYFIRTDFSVRFCLSHKSFRKLSSMENFSLYLFENNLHKSYKNKTKNCPLQCCKVKHCPFLKYNIGRVMIHIQKHFKNQESRKKADNLPKKKKKQTK